MKYTGMEVLWLFLVYSFLGWVLETAVGTIKRKRFTNRGFTTGPFCGVYGTAAVLMAAALQELRGNPVFLFLGCAAVATAVEWITGKTLERLNRKKMVGLFGKTLEFRRVYLPFLFRTLGNPRLCGCPVGRRLFYLAVSCPAGICGKDSHLCGSSSCVL